MTTVAETIAVTPKITAPSEIWFDANAGKDAPKRILGPGEGAALAQEIELTYSATLALNTATGADKNEYKGGATLTRSNASLELYTDASLDQVKKLAFCENKTRITNADLKKPLKLYAKGVEALIGGVTLTLALDKLETSEWKKTNFSSATQDNTINVMADATKTIEVKQADTVTPIIAIGRAEKFVRASGDALPITFKFNKTGTVMDYDGTAHLVCDPADAKWALYKKNTCEQIDKVAMNNGKIDFNAGDLKSDGFTYYAKATTQDAAGDVTLTLSLDANLEPAKVMVYGPAKQIVTIAKLNTVTPTLSASIDAGHDDAIWMPTLKRGALPTLKLGITQSVQDGGYTGYGVLIRSNANVDVFADKALTRPLSFHDNKAYIDNAELKTDNRVFYLKGKATGSTTLTLTLYDPKLLLTHIADPVTCDVEVKAATLVTGKVDWQLDEVLVGTSASDPSTAVKLYFDQTQSGGGEYTGVGVLTRSDKELAVFDANKKALFSGSDLSVEIANDIVMDAGLSYSALWIGEDMPEDDSVTLSLKPKTSSTFYIVTDPDSEVLADAQVVQPKLGVKNVNTVTPKIRTDYDVVMLDRSFADGKDEDRTTPVQAYIYATQSEPDVGYCGNGKLTRTNDNIRVFVDKACTKELTFCANTAFIPNGALKDDAAIYYIVGAKPGACGLSLALDGPNPHLNVRAGFNVAEPATKTLDVIKLAVDVYCDNSATTPATQSTALMSDRNKRLIGRFVALQNTAKSFGRAKVVVKKVDTSNWPDGTDNYVVTLNISNDKVRIYDAAENGNTVADKITPLQLKKADLANDKTYWMQSHGNDASLTARDVTVSLGLDRTDKDDADYPGKPDSIEAKSNGDWAAATVVTLTALTPDIANWRQYTNQPPDRTLDDNSNQNEAKDGRSILVTATVSPTIAGVGLDFMLVGDGANTPGIPDGLKAMKKDQHVSAVSDANGKANARLKLSRYGGDVFTAVAFLADDAATGETTFPVDVAGTPDAFKSKPIVVWRKLDYDLIFMKRHDGELYNPNNSYDGDYQNMFNQGQLETTFSTSFLEINNSNATVVNNVTTLYNATPPPVGGTAYIDWLNGQINTAVVQKPKDRHFTLIFIETIARGANEWREWYSNPAVSGNVFKASIRNRMFDLGSQGRYLKASSCSVSSYTLGFIQNWQQNVADNKVKVVDGDDGHFELQVDLTGIDLRGARIQDLWIRVTLKSLDYICGMSLGGYPYTFTAVRYAEQRSSNQNDEVYSTAVHEVGHFLGLAPKTLPDTAKTGNVKWYLGRGTTTKYYNRDRNGQPTTVETHGSKIGQGSHCFDGYNDFTDLCSNHGRASKVKCLMFDATVNPPITRVCDVCKTSVRAREYALSNTDGEADY